MNTSGPAMLPEAVVGWVVAEALAGLEYLHGLRFAHRDLKAANLLLELPTGRSPPPCTCTPHSAPFLHPWLTSARPVLTWWGG